MTIQKSLAHIQYFYMVPTIIFNILFRLLSNTINLRHKLIFLILEVKNGREKHIFYDTIKIMVAMTETKWLAMKCRRFIHIDNNNIAFKYNKMRFYWSRNYYSRNCTFKVNVASKIFRNKVLTHDVEHIQGNFEIWSIPLKGL